MLKSIWSWIEKNRFTVMLPILGLLIGLYAIGCTAEVANPVKPEQLVNAVELEQELLIWQEQCEITMRRFEFAAQDIDRQQQQMNAVQDLVIKLASGGVTSWQGLVPLVMGSGLVGLAGDNIRKNGVIGGLKRNKAA